MFLKHSKLMARIYFHLLLILNLIMNFFLGIIRLDNTSQHHNKKTPTISVGVFVVSNARSNRYEQKVTR